MREAAMWIEYRIAQERLDRLRAEGMAAQRVASLVPRGGRGRFRRAGQWRAWRRTRRPAPAAGQVSAPVPRRSFDSEVLCVRAAGGVAGRSA